MITSPSYLYDPGNNINISIPDHHTQFGVNGSHIKYVIMSENSIYGNKPVSVTVIYTKTTD